MGAFIVNKLDKEDKNGNITLEWTHKPVPITSDMPKKLLDCISYFLWYAPQSSSMQVLNTFETELLRNVKYSETMFNILYEKISKDIDTEVYTYFHSEQNGGLKKEHTEDFEDKKEVCLDNQVLFFSIEDRKNKRKESKSEALFRHIRNAISHGSFIIIGDFFLGKDEVNNKISAVMKIKINNLYNAINNLYDNYGAKKIVLDCYKNQGYEIDKSDNFLELPMGLYGGEMKFENRKYRLYIINKEKSMHVQLITEYPLLLPEFAQGEIETGYSSPEYYLMLCDLYIISHLKIRGVQLENKQISNKVAIKNNRKTNEYDKKIDIAHHDKINSSVNSSELSLKKKVPDDVGNTSKKEVLDPKLIHLINKEVLESPEGADPEPCKLMLEGHLCSGLLNNSLFNKDDQDFTLIIVGDLPKNIFEKFREVTRSNDIETILLDQNKLLRMIEETTTNKTKLNDKF